jgi:hypothetical protein
MDQAVQLLQGDVRLHFTFRDRQAVQAFALKISTGGPGVEPAGLMEGGILPKSRVPN